MLDHRLKSTVALPTELGQSQEISFGGSSVKDSSEGGGGGGVCVCV